MTSTTAALQVDSPGAPFKATTIERRDLRDDDIRIDIAFAGICHSDIHQVREEWGQAMFPMVPGHEIAGTVAEVGDGVTRYQVGDRVGVGCMVDSCGECEWCKDGEEQFCTKGAVMTYAGKDYHGDITMGGYSRSIVVSERFAVRIPDGLGLDVAAPLLCAGITTFNPLRRWGAGPGTKVAVIGIGGLGHMGVKLAAAMGAEVTALSRSMNKADDSVALGAVRHVATSDEQAMAECRGSFDIILNTVSADLPMDTYLALLRPRGVLVSVGLPTAPYQVSPFSVIGRDKVLTGSMIGGIQQTQEMLDFCAEHGVAATIETIDAAEVDQAYDKVVDGNVRYRVVIDTSTITPAEA